MFLFLFSFLFLGFLTRLLFGFFLCPRLPRLDPTFLSTLGKRRGVGGPLRLSGGELIARSSWLHYADVEHEWYVDNCIVHLPNVPRIFPSLPCLTLPWVLPDRGRWHSVVTDGLPVLMCSPSGSRIGPLVQYNVFGVVFVLWSVCSYWIILLGQFKGLNANP